jgi:Ca-activated chloride channel family protein
MKSRRRVNSTVGWLLMHKTLLILGAFLFATCSVFAQTKPQPLSLTYGLVIDCSGTVRPYLNDVSSAASLILKANSDSDETFVTKFISSDKIQNIQDLTSDKAALVDSLGGLFAEGGKSSIVDAVYFATQYLNDHTNNPRRAIVLITDGDERASFHKLDEVVSYLGKHKIPVYILAYVYDVKKESGSTNYKKALAFLDALATESGGKVVIADKANELPEKAAQIIRLLRS